MMKRIARGILIIILCLWTFKTQAQPAKIQFFPDLAFDDENQLNQFRVDWYTKNLIALEEPSILDLSKDKRVHVYRFLWLRSFDKPIALRLIVDPEGTGLLIKKITDGAGGYEPGRIVVNDSVPLKKEQVDIFLNMLNRLSFWQLSTKEKTDVLGLDGAQWIMEGAYSQTYHVVDRWSPEEGLYRQTALYLVGLAGLKIKSIY